MIETALVVLVMSIVLAVVLPTVTVFFSEQTTIQNTFGAVDQLVLASETVTRFVHEAVDASPNPPATPFVTASANAVTFTTNTGQANGPEEAVVHVTAGAGGTRTFGLSLIPAGAGSCPPCTYTGSSTDSELINYLTNGTGGSPVFTYLLQGGESCGGSPPGAAPTSLSGSGALTNGQAYTQLSVAGLPSAVSVGDSLFIGSGPTAQVVTATAVHALGSGTQQVTVSSFTAAAQYNSGTGVYDGAWGPVPATLPTTLSASLPTTGQSVTALPVNPLLSAVAVGDLVVVGSGTTTQTFTVATAEVVGQRSIPVTSVAANANYASGASVYDSSCSATTQLAQITAVSMNFQATKNPGGQPTGYQSLAYVFSPTYNASVG